MGIFGSLSNFDAYPKTLKEFQVKTLSGATISIISISIMILLFFSEFLYFLQIDKKEQLLVDATRNQQIKINFDVTFHRLPCSVMSVDTMDVTGRQQHDIFDGIYKKRLDADGKEFGSELRDTINAGSVKSGAQLISALQAAKENPPETPEPLACGSCYGAEETEGQCCNTCEDVRKAYLKKGWALSSATEIEQCQRESYSGTLSAQPNEGCRVYGFLQVNKLAGTFQLGPGHQISLAHAHFIDLSAMISGDVNVSHTVNTLSFGPLIPGAQNPLDSTSRSHDRGTGLYQYFVKVVPTQYKSIDGEDVQSYQYSVTDHFKKFEAGHINQLPGVAVNYDLSPIMVKITETRKSFLHFLTECCAIIGGIFTVTGMIDRIIFQVSKKYMRRSELSKVID